MSTAPPIRLPRQWPRHVKAGILHAISLASVVLSYARGRVTGRGRLRARLERTENEIALLREELAIKDGRWERSRSRRRPHYTPIQRMRILQLRAARGWTLEKTARVFLVDLHTLLIWMRRLDEHGERDLIRTVEPVNRYPDYIRNLVRQLMVLLPTLGAERLAQILGRAGLRLAATTIRRIAREKQDPSPEPEIEVITRRRRRVVARHPGDVWHVDLTAVPIRAGFWVPWLPFALSQRWPFCWWVAVAVDQVSRALVGFAVYSRLPGTEQVQRFLERAIRVSGSAPRCTITDKGRQFWCRSYRRWCKPRGIRPRYGVLGEPASIPITERFIRSMKQDALGRILVPLSLGGMRREVRAYSVWYNDHRPHTTLGGRAPRDVCEKKRRRRRFEPRARWPRGPLRRGNAGDRLRVVVSYVEGRRHLPVIELRRAA